MCDTLALVADGGVWFAKNSDREPGEPQTVVRLPRVSCDPRRTVRATHVEIPQAPDRYGVVLSKPIWVWGAEMGVNERCVAVGNEAIFSRRRSRRPGLLGMDLVRLGLERGGCARDALRTIVTFLERYGQGGRAGYRDRQFHYDNSFLIADPDEVWILETAGRSWVARRVRRYCVLSNVLILGSDYELGSPELLQHRCDFRRRFDTRLMPALVRARRRRMRTERGLSAITGRIPRPEDFFSQLRIGCRPIDEPPIPARASNDSVCMHAGGMIRRSQTTGSMVVRLTRYGPRAWFTGTSAPCLSLFRPVRVDERGWSVLTPLHRERYAPLWRAHESVHRRALFDAGLRTEIRDDLAETERRMLALDDEDADAVALDWQCRQRRRVAGCGWSYPPTPYGRYWRRQNELDKVE